MLQEQPEVSRQSLLAVFQLYIDCINLDLPCSDEADNGILKRLICYHDLVYSSWILQKTFSNINWATWCPCLNWLQNFLTVRGCIITKRTWLQRWLILLFSECWGDLFKSLFEENNFSRAIRFERDKRYSLVHLPPGYVSMFTLIIQKWLTVSTMIARENICWMCSLHGYTAWRSTRMG